MSVNAKTLIAAVMLSGCGRGTSGASVDPEIVAARHQGDPLAIADRLEALIAYGRDDPADREYAYEQARSIPDDGAVTWAFAQAAVAGRLAEIRGVRAGPLVGEIEAHARLAKVRDPEFRDGAITRMLGTLYVKAPARFVEHGDAEDGLSMLEALAQARPDDPLNHLRLAEAYLEFEEDAAARPHLCRVIAVESTLRPDDRILLGALVEEAGSADNLACEIPGI